MLKGDQRTFLIWASSETRDIPKISFQGQERTDEGIYQAEKNKMKLVFKSIT